MAEPAFRGAGASAGLELWRIEQLKPVKLEVTEFGSRILLLYFKFCDYLGKWKILLRGFLYFTVDSCQRVLFY